MANSDETDPEAAAEAVDADWSVVDEMEPEPEAGPAGEDQAPPPEVEPEWVAPGPALGEMPRSGPTFAGPGSFEYVRPPPPPPRRASGGHGVERGRHSRRYPGLLRKLTAGESALHAEPADAPPAPERGTEDRMPGSAPARTFIPHRARSAGAVSAEAETSDPARSESRTDPMDLDRLLTEMAKGLLIGTGPAGGTQVRLTLNDAFLAGTEVVIEVNDGRVRAEFIPPDRETYWKIQSESDRLQDMLSGRGFGVENVSVRFPPLS